MALNFPGPYELRLYYTVDTLIHVAKYNIDVESLPSVGADFSTINIIRRAAAAQALDAYVDTWVDLMRARYHSVTASFDYAELWLYAADSFDASYLSVYPIGLPGLGGTAPTKAQQDIFTFRTQEGGIMRINMLETSTVSFTKIPYGNLPAGALKDVMDFVAGINSGFLGRDTSYPVAPLNFLPGQNERVFKARYRT